MENLMFKITLMAAVLAVPTLAAFAHGAPPAPSHGGLVAEGSGEDWVELVISGDQLTVYVMDEAKNPVPSTKLSGKATVLTGGKSQTVQMMPGEANSLKGKLDPAATGKVTTVLVLAVSGKPTQARFSSVQQ